MSVKTRMDHQLRKLETKREMLMQLIISLSEEMYNKQPTMDTWSVGQAANHILLSEQLSLAYLKKKIAYPDSIPGFRFKSWGAVLLIKITLRAPIKVKAPKAINMWEQQPVLSAAELDQHWKKLRQELSAFLDQYQPAFGSHLVFKHPFAGRLTMHQMLIFLNDHLAHHLKQINTILKQVTH